MNWTLVPGLAGGALLGNAADKREEKHELAVAQAQAQATAAQTVNSMQDIVYMAQNHTPDDLIIAQIRASRVVFHLSGPDINNLQGQGVSQAVIHEMIATATRVPVRQVYVRDPAPVIVEERPVYIYREPPPPVGIGFRYSGRW